VARKARRARLSDLELAALGGCRAIPSESLARHDASVETDVEFRPLRQSPQSIRLEEPRRQSLYYSTARRERPGSCSDGIGTGGAILSNCLPGKTRRAWAVSSSMKLVA
jgi:hypothetical protein